MVQDQELKTDQGTVRLNLSVDDPTIIACVYIACFVLLGFLIFALVKHRKPTDKRLKVFTETKWFLLHTVCCQVLMILGFISIYVREPLLHTFNLFALCILAIQYNHLGCSKYGTLPCCKCRQHKLCHRILFTQSRGHLVFSGLCCLIALFWWIYYSASIAPHATPTSTMFASLPNRSLVTPSAMSDTYFYFLLILVSITLLHLVISAMFNRISLAVFTTLFALYNIIVWSALSSTTQTKTDYLFYECLLVYWLLFAFCLVSPLSFFCCSAELKLRMISLSLVGGFLSIFDLCTDLILIVEWAKEGNYVYVVLQIVFIVSGTVFSSFFIKRYYFKIDDKQYQRFKLVAHLCTLFGFGRLWHGVLAWDMDNHAYIMLLTNKMIKIWEMFLESYPSICLQLWIVLSSENASSSAVVWSLVVSVASITFTVFRILFFDHRARRRNSKMLGKEVDEIDNIILEDRFDADVMSVELQSVELHVAEHDEPESPRPVAHRQGHPSNPTTDVRRIETDPQQILVEDEQKAETLSRSSMARHFVHNNNNNNNNNGNDNNNNFNHFDYINYNNGNDRKDDAELKYEDELKFDDKHEYMQRQIELERKKRALIAEQQERRERELQKRRQERERELNSSQLTITFKHKPLGCTLYRGPKDRNAWIADIKENNVHISSGLMIGLYVHTINGAIVDNMDYELLLDTVKGLPAPVQVGFNKYCPLDPEDPNVQQLIQAEKCPYTDVAYAWHLLNQQSDTITAEDPTFLEKMWQQIQTMNDVDDASIVHINQNRMSMDSRFNAAHYNGYQKPSELRLKLFDEPKAERTQFHRFGTFDFYDQYDDSDEDEDDAHKKLTAGYFITQQELVDDSSEEEKFMDAPFVNINMNAVVADRLVDDDDDKFSVMEEEEKIGPFRNYGIPPRRDLSNQSDISVNYGRKNKRKLPRGDPASYGTTTSRGGTAAGMTPQMDEAGAKKLNLAELAGKVERVHPDEVVEIKFKHKPLGFDREAGHILGLNCKVRKIHNDKLKKAGLQEHMYIRRINDRYVERVKFVDIEALLRNTACPMIIEFRISPPPIPKKVLKRLEEKEKRRIRRQIRRSRARMLSIQKQQQQQQKEDDDLLAMEQQLLEEEKLRQKVGRTQEEVVLTYFDNKYDFQLKPKEAATDLHAMVAKLNPSALNKGLRLKMYVYKINGQDVYGYECEKILRMLHAIKGKVTITFCIYERIDFEHEAVKRLLSLHHSYDEIASAWKILNRRHIDSKITMNDEHFGTEMEQILEEEKLVQQRFLAKINDNRLVLIGRDLDPAQPITIQFTKTPLGFQIQSGDDLANGKNAKIHSIERNISKSGLRQGMLIKQINETNVENWAYKNISTLLSNQVDQGAFPLMITFVDQIALPHLKDVIKFTCQRQPLGILFEGEPSTQLFGDDEDDRAGGGETENAVVSAVMNEQAMRLNIGRGMYIHNVNGVDVMNNMKFAEIEYMLNNLKYPIDIGFIDMRRVLQQEKQQQMEHVQKGDLERVRSDSSNAGLMADQHGGKEREQDDAYHDEHDAMANEIRKSMDASNNRVNPGWDNFAGCLDDMFVVKNIYYLFFYLFTITDMYCRIFPMLLIVAYIRITDAEKEHVEWQYAVALSVAVLVWTYEAISYKKILMAEYSTYTRVARYTYFATFTISFFLLSTMGLAYLEKTVDFHRMLRFEYIGRMAIGLVLCVIVTVAQSVTNNFIFNTSLYLYFAALVVSAISAVVLERKHSLL